MPFFNRIKLTEAKMRLLFLQYFIQYQASGRHSVNEQYFDAVAIRWKGMELGGICLHPPGNQISHCDSNSHLHFRLSNRNAPSMPMQYAAGGKGKGNGQQRVL